VCGVPPRRPPTHQKNESIMAENTETDVKAFAQETTDHILKGLGQEDNPLAVLIPLYIEARLTTFYQMKDIDRVLKKNKEVIDGL
jgi:hypothetical protein